MEIIHNKLVRDKIPEIIEKDGKVAMTSILNDIDYKTELIKKLFEECDELKMATTHENYIEELADIYELITMCANNVEKSIEDIQEIARIKSMKNGSFEKRIYLEKVID